MLTAVTHMILRQTVKKWFAGDTDVHDTRRKLDRFIGLTDGVRRGWAVTPAGTAAGASLHMIAPVQELPANAPLVLYLHGGGYIVGGLKSHAGFCARLGQALGARVLFVDYRLAPEHVFPAALEDGIAAWSQAASLARARLYLAGDSAGGGLALAVAQAATRQGLRAPDGLILLSPWTDLTLSGASIAENAGSDSMLSAQILTRMRDIYLGGQAPGGAGDSPLFDGNAKLPPVLLIYSDSEVLRDDSTRLAAKLRAGGTAVTAFPYDGMPHVFPILATVPAAKRALGQIAAFAA